MEIDSPVSLEPGRAWPTPHCDIFQWFCGFHRVDKSGNYRRGNNRKCCIRCLDQRRPSDLRRRWSLRYQSLEQRRKIRGPEWRVRLVCTEMNPGEKMIEYRRDFIIELSFDQWLDWSLLQLCANQYRKYPSRKLWPILRRRLVRESRFFSTSGICSWHRNW